MEPLESAGHYLADIGTMVLAEYFPFEGDTDACAFRYNRIMANRFYEILDFANMQYSLTKRVDTAFWREVAQPEHVNERVRARLDYWKLKAPSMSDFVDQRFPGQQETALPTAGLPGDHRSPVDTAAVFGLERHEAMLYGMQFLADECDEWFGTARPPTQVPRYILGDLQRAPATLPPHDQFLQRAAGMASYATAEGQRR
jgi:tryptophan halogenase